MVFAGDPDQPAAQTAFACAVRAELKTSGFAGALTYLDIRMTGTLADLVQARATWP